jgi:hypothetical protein
MADVDQRWICSRCGRFRNRSEVQGANAKTARLGTCKSCGASDAFVPEDSAAGSNIVIDLLYDTYRGRLQDAGYDEPELPWPPSSLADQPVAYSPFADPPDEAASIADTDPKVAGILATIPNPAHRRSSPIPGDLKGRYSYWFDGGACREDTGVTTYDLRDGTRIVDSCLSGDFLHILLPGVEWVRVKTSC